MVVTSTSEQVGNPDDALESDDPQSITPRTLDQFLRDIEQKKPGVFRKPGGF